MTSRPTLISSNLFTKSVVPFLAYHLPISCSLLRTGENMIQFQRRPFSTKRRLFHIRILPPKFDLLSWELDSCIRSYTSEPKYGFVSRLGTFFKGGQGKVVRNNTIAELSAGTKILKRKDATIKENKLGMWYYIPLPEVHPDNLAFEVKGVMLRVFDCKTDEDIAEVQLPKLGRIYTIDDLKIKLERRDLVVNVPDYIDKLLPVNWDKDAVKNNEPGTNPMGKKD